MVVVVVAVAVVVVVVEVVSRSGVWGLGVFLVGGVRFMDLGSGFGPHGRLLQHMLWEKRGTKIKYQTHSY